MCERARRYPRLRSIYERFYALPALQPYFAGPLHRLPINGRSAHFGFSTDYLQLKPPADEGGEAKSDKIVVGFVVGCAPALAHAREICEHTADVRV